MSKSKSFKEFCIDTANKFIFDGNIENVNVPEEYKVAVDSIIEAVKYKADRFDKVHISFIENAINDVSLEDFAKVFNDKTKIPEGIFEKLSKEIFGKSFNNLDNDEMSIIKTIGIYLIISK